MSEPILIIGTRAIAAALGIGRNRLLAWLDDPQMGLPASRRLLPGRWVASRQNLIDWSVKYFQADGPSPARAPAPASPEGGRQPQKKVRKLSAKSGC